jgi:uncharacterized membrane-anchored protein
MQSENCLWLAVLTILSICGTARGDLLMHDFGPSAAQTLDSLGTNFVIGCVIIAVAIIVSAAICARRKN